MSEILKKIKEDLKEAMKTEVYIIKNPANGDFIVSQMALFETCIAQKTVSRSIISMLPEIGKKADQTTDEDIIKLLKKYISNEKERRLYIDKHLTERDVSNVTPAQIKKIVSDKMSELGDKLTSTKIQIAQKYLPLQASEEEIKSWIEMNIDFSKFKNKMQAMGPIMKNFQGSDGNFIKSILMKI